MTFENVLCVLKTTNYEHYKLQHKSLFQTFHTHRKILLEQSHRAQKKFEEEFKAYAKELGLAVTYCSEHDLAEYIHNKYDLVISFGGDGTFLKVAQHFRNTLLLGVNSDQHLDPAKGSVGALTSISLHTYKDALYHLVKGDYVVQEWKRLYAKINDTKVPELATNDVYFGALEAYKTSSFELYYDGQVEGFQGSSGLLLCTGMGSTAWFKNAQGTPFSQDLSVFAFKVRDPHIDRMPTFVQGIVDGAQELVISPLRGGQVLAFDSHPHTYTLQESDELRIGLSEEDPVTVIRFE